MANVPVQLRRIATTAEALASTEVLLDGQWIYNKETKRKYCGDGIKTIAQLMSTDYQPSMSEVDSAIVLATDNVATELELFATNAANNAETNANGYTDSVAATKQNADADLTAIAGLSPANDDIIQRKAGAWTNRTITQLAADIFSTVGNAIRSLTTPAATSWIRINTDGTVTERTAAETRTDLGVPAGSGTSTGTNTGDQTSVTGNAGTATALQTARTIQTNLASTSAASFDGTANITPGVTGTLPIANGGTGGTTVSGANTNLETSAVQRILLPQGAALTNQPNSLEILSPTNPGIFVNRVNLTNFTEVLLQVHVFTASASANSPRVILGYSTTYTITPGSFSDIGTSAVTCSMSTAGVIQSGWVSLAAGAKADVYITGLTNGGNGTADPVISMVTAFFR